MFGIPSGDNTRFSVSPALDRQSIDLLPEGLDHDGPILISSDIIIF